MLVLLVTLVAFACQNRFDTFSIDIVLTDNLTVELTPNIPDGILVNKLTIYRSNINLEKLDLDEHDLMNFPITRFVIAGENGHDVFFDSCLAHHVSYYYKARLIDSQANGTWSKVVQLEIPDTELEITGDMSILIDKEHYFLEIREEQQIRKRYPIALGQNPFTRKLHQDNSTTPEGIYHIYNLQPRATFYRAFDMNYPNDVDRARYNISIENGLIGDGRIPGIGGEIQIHGKGINSNWTWGCIAMRNQDIDELFGSKRIRVGTMVIIVGHEVKLVDVKQWTANHNEEMIRSIQRSLCRLGYKPGTVDGVFGFRICLAIGHFQMDNNLPLTCEMDPATVNAILKQEKN